MGCNRFYDQGPGSCTVLKYTNLFNPSEELLMHQCIIIAMGELKLLFGISRNLSAKVGRKNSETDPIKSQSSSKTSHGKKDVTKRHQ